MKRPSAPEFWTRPGLAAQLLEPLAWAHAAAGTARRALVTSARAPVPVVCVGNLVAGGAGKTPVVLSLARRLAARGARPHLLSRGYGGRLTGPVAVDRPRHDADMVGDEALLLAVAAPTWIARDRVAGAAAAAQAGADIVILDDGFQNPHLAHDLALLVIDGSYGVGNGRVMPAGPLREPLAAALARADAVVLMGNDEAGIAQRLGAVPVLRAALAPTAPPPKGPIVAFAGIGRPAKFFRTLTDARCRVVACEAFPDHHRYQAGEVARLEAAARAAGARLVTTEKDWVRLPAAWRARVEAVAVAVRWENEAALDALLARIVA